MSYGTNLQARTQKSISLSTVEVPTQKKEDIKEKSIYFIRMSDQANEAFCQTYKRNMQLYGDFVKQKHR
jgi:hypothetical protein